MSVEERAELARKRREELIDAGIDPSVPSNQGIIYTVDDGRTYQARLYRRGRAGPFDDQVIELTYDSFRMLFSLPPGDVNLEEFASRFHRYMRESWIAKMTKEPPPNYPEFRYPSECARWESGPRLRHDNKTTLL